MCCKVEILYKGIVSKVLNMSIDENLKIVRLIDTYGSTLTEKQFSIISSYYFDNLTLAEIGENMGISRQAVSDSISQSIKSVTNLESKLGVISRGDELIGDLEELLDGLDNSSSNKLMQIIEKYRR